MSKDYAYTREFWQATSVLETVADCRGNNPGPEEDAECDSIDALLEFLSGLEWEYNIQIEEHGATVMIWEWEWKPRQIAEEGMRRLRKDLKGKIVKRVKAGEVQDA